MEKPETSFKDMKAKQKIGYIWDYYKVLVFALVIIIGVLIYVVYAHVHPDAESICNVALVDVESYGSDDDVFARYLEEKGYDTDAFTINTTFIDTSTYNAQLLSVELMTGEVDVIIADSTVMQNLLDSGALEELDEWLDSESDEENKENKDTTENVEDAENRDSTEDTEDIKSIQNEDTEEKLTDTDSAGTEHVYAIRLPEGNEIIYDGYYTDDVWVGISINAMNYDEALELISYLMTVQDHSGPYTDMSEFLETLTEAEK